MSSASEKKPLHILFVGAGAVGCFYASRLHQPSDGVLVSLVCRSNYETIAQSGVFLETHTFGNYHFVPHSVFPSIVDGAKGTPENGWDYVIVTTKALPEKIRRRKDIEPLIKAKGVASEHKTCIVLIQNGVGIEETHRTRFPNTPIVSAVTIVNAEQIRHGVVRQNRWTRISIGPYSDGTGGNSAEATALAQKGAQHVQQLVTLFTQIGKLRDAEAYDEVGLQHVRWHKICINAAMNPSAVLSGGVSNASMVADPELRLHLKGVMEEVFEAAPKILGRPFPEKLATPRKILESTARSSDKVKPSMLVDWENRRPLELEVILGNPIRIARRHGVEMRRMETLYALLKSAQKQKDRARVGSESSKI